MQASGENTGHVLHEEEVGKAIGRYSYKTSNHFRLVIHTLIMTPILNTSLISLLFSRFRQFLLLFMNIFIRFGTSLVLYPGYLSHVLDISVKSGALRSYLNSVIYYLPFGTSEKLLLIFQILRCLSI